MAPSALNRSVRTPADKPMNLLDICSRRRQPGPDRPDRLIGHHQIGRRRSIRQRALRAGRRRRPASARHRAASRVSPMQTMAMSPARQAASAFCRTSASVSPWSARRSEWPTMMALAPASPSISAERSPVWAPEALGWQSWAPTASVLEPRALSANAAIRVAGGQTSRSALAATAAAPVEHGLEFGQWRT